MIPRCLILNNLTSLYWKLLTPYHYIFKHNFRVSCVHQSRVHQTFQEELKRHQVFKRFPELKEALKREYPKELNPSLVLKNVAFEGYLAQEGPPEVT